MKKKLLTLVMVAAMAVSMVACGEEETSSVGSVDTISQASEGIFYEKSSWDEAKVKEVLANNVSTAAAVVLSTTNEDGTPNAATIVPGMVNDNTLVFNIASEGNTKLNLVEREIAVLTIFNHNAGEEDKFVRNQGARVVLKTVTDEAKIEALVKEAGLEDGSTAVFTEMVEFLPLG